MERLSDHAIEIVNELHTEKLAYESEYVPIIDALNRLAEYEDAEEQGLLVRLPCKLGQEVWIAPFCGEVCRGKITKIEENIYTEPTTRLTVEYVSDFIGKHEYTSRIDLMLNKTVFLTREAAEKALEDA